MTVDRARLLSRVALLSSLLLLVVACAAPRRQILRTEKDYQLAFNDAFFRGRAHATGIVLAAAVEQEIHALQHVQLFVITVLAGRRIGIAAPPHAVAIAGGDHG